MKRFYCNTCRRIKRVRSLPNNVRPIVDVNGVITGYTAGDCNRHKPQARRR